MGKLEGKVAARHWRHKRHRPCDGEAVRGRRRVRLHHGTPRSRTGDSSKPRSGCHATDIQGDVSNMTDRGGPIASPQTTLIRRINLDRAGSGLNLWCPPSRAIASRSGSSRCWPRTSLSPFAQIEVKRGIMPAAAATIRMTERAGLGNALRYLLTG